MTKAIKSIITFTPSNILNAYCNGYFPMGNEHSREIDWYRPNPRAVFLLEKFHTPRSLKKFIKNTKYSVKINSNFEKVINLCAVRDEQTWISQDIKQAYIQLNQLGYAHSLEIYQHNNLLGGLYGISINGVFFGESMFNRKSNFSKIALCELVYRMKKNKMYLLDSQFYNDHLKQFNLSMITDTEYMNKLSAALKTNTSFL